MNEDLVSSGSSNTCVANGSSFKPNTNKKLDKINCKGLLGQENGSDNLQVAVQIESCEKAALIKSLQFDKKTCPYSTVDISGRSKAKCTYSQIKSLGNSCIKDKFSTMPFQTKSTTSCDNYKTMKDVPEIDVIKQSCVLNGELMGPLNPKLRKVNDSAIDLSGMLSVNLQSGKCDIKGCLSRIKKEEEEHNNSSSLQDMCNASLPVSSNHCLDPRLNRHIKMQSSNSSSTNGLHAAGSNVKALKMGSKNLNGLDEIKKDSSCLQGNEKQTKNPTMLNVTCIQSENISLIEKPIRKRKQYQNHKTSEETNDVLKKDLLSGTATTSDQVDNSLVLSPLKGNVKIEDDVGNLGMGELEQIREALRQQLLGDVNAASPEVLQSRVHGESTEKSDIDLSGQVDKTCIQDRSDQVTPVFETSQSIEQSFKVQSEHSVEHSVNQINCFIPKITDQPSAELFKVNVIGSSRTTPRFENMPEECPVNDSKQTEEKLPDEGDPIIDQPPLVMQSSNLLFNDELDNRHGGGGIETTRIKEEPETKKLKLNSDHHDSNFDHEPSTVVNSSKITISSDDLEKQSLQPDDLASNSPLDHLNSDQNIPMEFDILDEFESEDNDPNEDFSGDSDLSADEIDAMLDEGLESSKGTEDNKDLEHEEKEKVILKVRGRDHFDVLPEGWIEVTHNSGMPIYLHKQTRVCSVSKPYFLGPGSTRKHEIPVSAIPCLHYLRELEKENSEPKMEENQNSNSPVKLDTVCTVDNGIAAVVVDEKMNSGIENLNAPNIPSAKLESVKDTKESGSLDYIAVREYCKKRFEFQTITVKRFRTWSGRRKHQKQLKRKQRPFLPDSTKLITCPLFPSSDKNSNLGNNTKREFIMNPSGKSPVCILHEYVQHTLRVQPKYIFKELENANTPYGAVVMIDGIEYGCGFGSSKKLAKSDAAKSALQILIPKMKMFSPEAQNGEENQDVEFFDQVRVEDPRVCDLSVKAGQPYPYQILLECLKRNYGMGDTEIEFWMANLKHQKNEFFMKVGKHQISVICKNKRDGKHRASQAVLQLLHPHIKSWGSLLRMYGKGSCKTLKEKKEEEQRITELQSQACVNKPNMSILNKLKEEMLKYREKMMSKKPIGKLIPERMEFFSTSNSNLNNVEL